MRSWPASKIHICILAQLVQTLLCGQPHCFMPIPVPRLLIHLLPSCQALPTSCFPLDLCFTLPLTPLTAPPYHAYTLYQNERRSGPLSTVVLESP